jgi:hypothetical protein
LSDIGGHLWVVWSHPLELDVFLLSLRIFLFLMFFKFFVGKWSKKFTQITAKSSNSNLMTVII